MSIEVRRFPIEEIREHDWNNFDHGRIDPANTTAYASLYAGIFSQPLLLEILVDGRKVGQWVLQRKRALRQFFLHGAISSHAGPYVAEEARKDYDSFFASSIDYLRDSFNPNSITVLNYALTRNIPPSALERAGFTRVERFFSYVNVLESDDAILSSFHDSHRNDTRKAIRDGYEYRPAISPEEYFRISRETYDRSGQTGPTLRHLKALWHHVLSSGYGLLSGVFVGGNLEAGSLVISSGPQAFYVHGASISKKTRGSTTYLHYENMRTVRERGVRHYDFGGARVSEDASEKSRSISAFKARFGGTLIESHGGMWP